MTEMPTMYETKTTSTVETTHSQSQQGLGCYVEYMKTIPGILKIVELVCDLIVVICASLIGAALGGWSVFLSASAFVTTALLLIFVLTNLLSKLPGPWTIIQFAYFVIYALLYFITACVLASVGYYPPAGAGAFFGFAACAVYAVDAFLMFRAWRMAGSPTSAPASQTVATTTVTSVETVQY